jgi:tetratricopeptide (TPR) repeat protein
VPASNRHAAAVFHRELARLHAEAGRLDVAKELLAQAEPELAEDRKQHILLDAIAALVHAMRGERADASARIAAAEASLDTIPEELRIQKGTLLLIGRAALLIDRTAQAEALLQSLLKLDPNPAVRPEILFHLADCRRRQGDLEGARELDLSAAATRFGTLYERRARDRLELTA